jgi:DNA-binding response OmpR family regulator
LEFDLLVALARAPRRVFTREQLMETVWGWDFVGVDRVVDVHISNLRKALDDNTAEPRFIGTVRGVGYKFIGTPA